MAQATLTAANVVQAKTGSGTTAPQVSLDAGTQAGSTVTIELTGAGTGLTDADEGGAIPAGFELAAVSDLTNLRYLWVFHKRQVAAGEGVAGSTSWNFNPPTNTLWSWRVTEWNTDLEPVSPLEAVAKGTATGTSVTTVSTGTTATTSRPVAVALAMHLWSRSSNTAESFDWSGHTNGFVERDELRLTAGVVENDICWSWKFLEATEAVECSATVNLTTRAANDLYIAHVVVYAATTYA